MRESIFSGRIPITSTSEDIPWQMKCEVVKRDDKVEIRLIDTRDLFSFFICSISSGDFYLLKREQDIRVDFETFIRKLVEMFHSLTINKLIGIFSRENNKFTFLERNDFKNIVRLEIKFTKPDEIHYKRYLSDLIYKMESDNVKLIKENNFLKEQCKTGDLELQERIKFLEMDLKESERRCSNFSREIGSLEDKYLRRATEFDRIERENFEMREDLRKISLEFDRLKENEFKTQTNLRKLEEFKQNCSSLEDQIKELKEENQNLMLENEKIKLDLTENKEELRELKSLSNKQKRDLEDYKEKFKINEEKFKTLRSSTKLNESKFKDLENENKILKKKLDNQQSVWYNLNRDRTQDSDDTQQFVMRPDSPPK